MPTPSARTLEDAPTGFALVVTVRWGESVLHVAHVSPPRAFRVGEGRGVDLHLPAEALGARRVEIVRMTKRRPCFAAGDGEPVELLLGEKREVALGQFDVSVELVRPAERAPRLGRVRVRRILGHALSVSMHAGFLAAAYVAFPPEALSSGVEEQRALLERHVEIQAPTAEMPEAEAAPMEPEESRGYAERGPILFWEQPTMRRLSFERPVAEARRPTTRWEAQKDSTSFGMTALLDAMDIGPPPRQWSERPSAQDIAVRHLWSSAPGSIAGLELSGVGQGAGTRAKPIDLGIGEMGMRKRGAMPIAKGVVGQGCFDRAALKDAGLAGTVTVRLRVDDEGVVTSGADAGSEIGDASVAPCVARAYVGLRVEQSGPATVTRSHSFVKH